MNKKIICLFLCVVLCLSMLACGKKQEKDPTIPAAEPTVNNTMESEENTPAATTESVPGVVEASIDVDWGEAEDDTSAATENPSEGSEPGTTGTSANTSTTVGSSTDPTTEPTVAPTEPTSGEGSTGLTDYERYNAMSGEEQEAFVETFDSLKDFVAWYNAAKAEYERLHPPIEVGDGEIDLGELDE